MQVDASTLDMLWRSVSSPHRALPEIDSHMVLTLSGPDRMGLVAQLTRWIYEHGGSVLTSKMVRVGGEFAVMLHVSAQPERMAPLRATLHDSITREFDDMHVHSKEIKAPQYDNVAAAGTPADSESLRRRSTLSQDHRDRRGADRATAAAAAAEGDKGAPSRIAAVGPACGARIRCSGTDRPGLLYRIADFLSAQHLNIDDLQTELRSTVLGDRAVSLFLVEGKVTGTGDDVQRLRVRAGELSKELGISIEVTEVEIL